MVTSSLNIGRETQPEGLIFSRKGSTVATLLLPGERNRVDAAGEGSFVTVHAETIDEAVVAVKRRRADAVVLSVHRCDEPDLPRVARFVREFPHVPAVALVSRTDAASSHRILRLGASGVRSVVDVSGPAGWHQLRALLREPTSPVAAAMMAALEPDIFGVPSDCRLFFEYVARRAPDISTIAPLAKLLCAVPSSLMSRFYRAAIPSPKTYLAHARLVHAAYYLGSEGLSIADVANRLDYSSPQCFGRHLRTLLGMTPGEFRRRMPFPVTLERYRRTFVTPYRDRLLVFHPLGTAPGDHGHSAA
jgi:AraC-like DNA-binding protein